LYINGKQLLVESGSQTELNVVNFNISLEKLVKHITLEVSGQEDEYYIVGPEEQTGEWQRWVEAPLEGVRNFLIFRSEGTIYAGYGEGDVPNPQQYSSLYAYQPVTGSWELVSQFTDASVLSQKRVWQKEDGTTFLIGRNGPEWLIYRFLNNQQNWTLVSSLKENSELISVFAIQYDAPRNGSFLGFRNGKSYIFEEAAGESDRITLRDQHLDTSFQESQVLFIGSAAFTRLRLFKILVNRDNPNTPYEKTYWYGSEILERGTIKWNKVSDDVSDILQSDIESELAIGVKERESVILQVNQSKENAIYGYGSEFPDMEYNLPVPASARSLFFPDDRRTWVIHNGYVWSLLRE
jgi:hypothetical protein